MPETFSPIAWVNNTFPAISAPNLNRLEQGLESLDDRADQLEKGIVTPIVVSYTTSVTLNATQGSLFRCVATGDLTLDDIVGGIDGQTIVFEVQASGAQRTLHFTGSTNSTDIAVGQWWVGVFRFVASAATWLLDDGASGSGGGSSNNGLNILAPQNLPYAATITPNAASGALFRITAIGDFTLASPTNGTDGQAVVIEVVASGGTRTVSFAGDPAPVVLSAGSRWTVSMRYHATDDIWLLSGSGGGSAGTGGSTGSSSYVTVQDEGASLTARTTLNFLGTGVAVADDPTNGRTNVTITSGSGGTLVLQDEGASVAARTTLNFVGAGVTVTDDAANSRTQVAIGGGSGGYATIAEEGSSLTSRSTLNFVGRPVTATDNSGSTRTDVTVLDTVPVHAVGNSGTALTLDAAAAAGPVKLVTLTGNCTFTFSGVTSGREVWMRLVLTQDATGSRTVTWPASVRHPGGSTNAPVLSTTAGSVDQFLATTFNGGTTWYLDTIGKGYA